MTDDVMRVPVDGTALVIQLDATRNEAGGVAGVALFQLVHSICGYEKKSQTRAAIDALLDAKPHLVQVFLLYSHPVPTLILP
jgi:hypothetical protein